MVKAYLKSAVAGAFLIGMTTAALAVTGEFNNMCTMGLATGKDIQTDCSKQVSVPLTPGALRLHRSGRAIRRLQRRCLHR